MEKVEEHWAVGQETWVLVTALSLPGSMTSGKTYHISEPLSPHSKSVFWNRTCQSGKNEIRLSILFFERESTHEQGGGKGQREREKES